MSRSAASRRTARGSSSPGRANSLRNSALPAKKKSAPDRILLTGGAGFIGSNLALEIERRWPSARVTIVDDFRSGDFRNLTGFRGDVVAKNAVDYAPRATFDIVFHLASITDTTVHDQRLQVHDNVEGFRAVLGLAPRVVYASSAATYGITDERMSETTPPRPANVYAFSKVVLDNIAREHGAIGVRYFNVYGPREAHKKAAASMIYQLAVQMRSGRRPRVFKHGEQKRDFVYVKDVVTGTLLAAERGRPGVYNIGSGLARSFNDIIAALNSALGLSLDPDYFDCPYDFYQTFTEADLAKAQRELGYEPRFDLETGIRDYAKWLGWAAARAGREVDAKK
ncbi:MAG: NAD-dependent epimerase/dehydratase family protein [Planctomycetes bacterium]|nr:NAD-dependent epimerase/dehydratase family protein [Planctomycetota bacterium]